MKIAILVGNSLNRACNQSARDRKNRLPVTPSLADCSKTRWSLEALKARFNAEKQPELYYFRDHNGLEVDLILNEGRTLLPFEIKSAMTWNLSFASNLKKFMKLSDEIHDPTVIYAGDLTPETESAKYINFRDTAKGCRYDSENQKIATKQTKKD